MNPRRFVATATFRLALLYAAIFSLSTLVLFAFMYWRVGQYGLEQIRLAIDAEIAVILDEEKRGRTVRDAVEELSTTASSLSNYYLLQDARGVRLAGNIAPLQPQPGITERRVRELRPARASPGSESALVRGVQLPGGDYLAIGRVMSDLDALNRAVLQAALGTILVTAGVALAGGLLLGAGVLRRVEVMADTSADIIAGDLNRRIPLAGNGDELDRLAESLNRMLDRIQQLMEGMRQVSSDIAHDLRTPIAHLRRRLERLPDLAENRPSELRQELETALDEVDGILGTFSALLRIAQIEAGARRSGFRPVDLSAVAETLAETYLPVAEDRGQVLTSEVLAEVAVVGDRELLTQMFANLLENAIRHSPPGAAIAIGVGRDAAGRALATVSDTGPGIPEAEVHNVFRRFYRLERNRTTAGNGLGLSLVAAVAELHGIDVRLSDARPGLKVELRF